MIRINNHIFFVLNHVYKTSLKTSLKCFKAPSLYNKNNTENSQLKSQQTLGLPHHSEGRDAEGQSEPPDIRKAQ